MATYAAPRSLFAVSFSVWKALFLREALYRILQDRVSWLWLIVEPVAHVALLIWLFTTLRQANVAGANTVLFVLVGVVGFFLMRNVMTRGMDAITQSESLFTYRQVKPVDVVLIRAVVEGCVQIVVLLVLIAGVALYGAPVMPEDPLAALAALAALWLMGLGLALNLSVAGTLFPEITHIVRLLVNPFYFLSAVMYPSIVVPYAMREILLLNPVVHALESLRVAFMPLYQVPHGINLLYPAGFALILIALGLALHIRYQFALIEK